MLIEPVKICIGYDPTEAIAWHVCAHSILSRATIPVSIIPLRLQNLQDIHTRKRHPLQSTEFSFTRFLTPYLSGYSASPVLYMDCDMIMLDDIKNLLIDVPYKPVSVVKHRHVPVEETKNLGAKQTPYPYKNWSSFMLFWPPHHDCRKLTPEYVDTADGLDLHQFKWTDKIGELPHRWNHLVGYDDDLPAYKISVLHWTAGGPWWPQYEDVAYATQWHKERRAMEASYDP